VRDHERDVHHASELLRHDNGACKRKSEFQQPVEACKEQLISPPVQDHSGCEQPDHDTQYVQHRSRVFALLDEWKSEQQGA
jgi:hypothetical protein